MVIDPAKVEAAVGKVLDPHINVPLTEMGMLSSIDVEDTGDVDVALVLPCMGCPAFSMLKNDVKRQVQRVDGVRDVHVRFDWEAKWDRTKMSDRAKEYAASSGYRI